MRKLAITDDGAVYSRDEGGCILCPLTMAASGEVEQCDTACAWFRKDVERASRSGEPERWVERAYCGDKLIGEIVE